MPRLVNSHPTISAAYLSDYLDTNGKMPPISLETVLKASGLVESMLEKIIKPVKGIVVKG